MILNLCPFQNKAAAGSRLVAHGRWASCLLPGSFGRYQNLLRMILIDIATLVIAPKEARPQALFSFSLTKSQSPYNLSFGYISIYTNGVSASVLPNLFSPCGAASLGSVPSVAMAVNYMRSSN